MKTKSLRKLLNGYGATSMVYCMFGITMSFVIEHLLRTCMPDLPACTIALLAALTFISVFIKRLNNHLVRMYNNKLAKDAYELAEQLKYKENIEHDVLKELINEVRNSDAKN